MKGEYVLQKVQRNCEELVRGACRELYGVPEEALNSCKAAVNWLPGKKLEGADISCAVFAIAKRAGESPDKTSGKVAKALEAKLPIEVARVHSLNGYVNFELSPNFYTQVVDEILASKNHFGKSPRYKGKTAVVEFSQPNVGKPMHFGHIRSTIFGDSLRKLLESQGYKCIAFNYLGDSGAQVAKLLLALEMYKELPPIKNERDMLEYYVRVNTEIENSDELKKKTRDLLDKIEAGEQTVQKQLDKIRRISIDSFKRNYKLLDVEFDEITGESAFVEKSKQIVKEMLERKIAFREPTGEIVADLEQHGLPNTILMRSNGTTLYLTRDLALADYKHEKYHFDLSVITTASEQNLHFKQVFKVMELLGRKYNSRHIGFGLIGLPEGKMSTRAGKVVLLEDVINQAVETAREKVKEAVGKDREYTETELREISEGVGIGALKFAVLRVGPEKNITFDFDAMTSFEGDTGAYLQYSLVRVKSVLKKAKALRPKIAGSNFNKEEKELMLALAAYPIVLSQATDSLTPHTACDYLLKLASMFSTFYAKHPIINAEPQQRGSRLAITKATGTVLENGLNVIGITPLRKM